MSEPYTKTHSLGRNRRGRHILLKQDSDGITLIERADLAPSQPISITLSADQIRDLLPLIAR